MATSPSAFPDTFIVHGQPHAGLLEHERSKVQIPYTDPLAVQIGDLIVRRVGAADIQFRVVGIHDARGAASLVDTDHANLLTLDIEDVTAIVRRTSAGPRRP